MSAWKMLLGVVVYGTGLLMALLLQTWLLAVIFAVALWAVVFFWRRGRRDG